MIRKEKIDGCDYWVSRDNQTGKFLFQNPATTGDPKTDRLAFTLTANFDKEIHSKFHTPELRSIAENIDIVNNYIAENTNLNRFF